MKLNETKSFLRISVIYGIYNSISNKWYIGSCIDLKDRMQRHRYYLRHNIHHSNKLQRAYNKYGEDSFDIIILKFLKEEDDRFKIEEDYIRNYDSVNNGYNILSVCKEVIHFKLSEQAKKHLQQYQKTIQKQVLAINRYTGVIEKEFQSVTEASNYYNTSSSNISRACKGIFNYIKDKVFIYKKDFDETKDYRKPYNHNKGTKFSEEHKRKMAENHYKSIPIYKYDLQGNLLEKYLSRAEAERQNNLKKEYLRHRIDVPINGFIYSTKIKI